MNIVYSIPPFLTLCCFIFLAFLSAVRGKKNRINRLFLIICILCIFLYTDILLIFNIKSSETALIISRLDHFFIVYLIPLYIHFFHAYLRITKRNWIILAAYLYAFVLMCFSQTPFIISEMQRHSFGFYGKGGSLYFLIGIGAAFSVVYVLTLIYQAMSKETSGIQKSRLKYIFFGFGFLGILTGFNTLPLLGYPVYPPGNFGFIPLAVFGTGLFRYDLFDTGMLIRKSVVYSLLTIVLTLIYSLIVTGINKAFEDADATGTAYFPLFLFFVVTVVYGPAKTRIQTLVDSIFLKGKYDYRKTIKELSQTVSAVLDMKQVASLLTETISDCMKTGNCSVFIGDFSQPTRVKYIESNGRTSSDPMVILDDSPVVTRLNTSHQPIEKNRLLDNPDDKLSMEIIPEMEAIQASVIFPMIFQNRLNGFLVIGEKKSGDQFFPEDMDLLETLANQVSLSVENARAYKEIDDLNKNLEKKVEDRTARLQQSLMETKKTKDLLIRSESLAAIGVLVAGVAHELNNPLASAMSLLQSAREELASQKSDSSHESEILEDLEFAGKELVRAKSIVSSLLALSRQTKIHSEPVDLNLVIKDALQILRNLYKNSHVKIKEQYAEDIPLIYGNFASMGQVALNIIQNAIQAVSSQTPGEIHIRTLVDRVNLQIIFECQDSGPGVPESIQNDIFKPFFTTKDAGKGTGLGLYICHDIVQRHGGVITLEKNNGKGARFVVKFPFDTKDITISS